MATTLTGLLSGLWQGGAPYRQTLAGLLSGDTTPLQQAGQSLKGLLDPAYMQGKMAQAQTMPPMSADNVMDNPGVNAALNFAPIGMFIGKGAKVWDVLKADEAANLAKQGVDPRAIWQKTGTFQGADGAWRQELDDSKSVWKKEFTTPFERNIQGDLRVKDALDHNALFNNYGELADTSLHSGGALRDLNGGSYSKEGGVTVGNLKNGESSKSVTLHELQHAIQEREGWARGGMPEGMKEVLDNEKFSLIEKEHDALLSRFNQLKNEWDGKSNIPQSVVDEINTIKPRISSLQRQGKDFSARIGAGGIDYKPDELQNAYRRLAGEAEARATQARMNMTMPERLNTFPFDSYDVPKDQLILRGMLSK